MPANHTPGKWTTMESGKPGVVSVVRFYDDHDGNGEKCDFICEVGPYIGAAKNAELIAAAPEMLEALEALLKSGEETNYAFYAVGSAKALKAAFHGQKELLHKARSVIEKATQHEQA